MDDRHKANGTRLNRLLINLGTEAMRNYFDSCIPPATLTATLRSHRAYLCGLGVLNRSQKTTLFPPLSMPPTTSNDYDISLFYVLFRNICGLHRPTSTGSWDLLPPSHDKSKVADLARIKYYRNNIYGHINSTKVDDATFNLYWNDISGAINRLGINAQRIRKLKTGPLEENNYRKLFYGGLMVTCTLCILFLIFYQKLAKDYPTLSPLDFSLYLNTTSKDFVGRKWLFREIEETVNNSGKHFDIAIIGDPGCGKSAVMSKLITSSSSSQFIHNNIIGYYMCKFEDERTRSGVRFVATIVEQLSRTISEYNISIKEPRIQDELNNQCKNSPVGCFNTAVFEPLAKIKTVLQNTTKFILIDAFDECMGTSMESSPIVTIVKNIMTKFPSWMKLIITSRNKTSLIAKLPTLEKIRIKSTDQRNLEDIRLYINHSVVGNDRFKNKRVMDCVTRLIKQLDTTSEGNFLYFKLSLQYLNEGGLCKQEEIPTVIVDYGSLFRDRYIKEDFEGFAPLFEVLLALNTPPSIDELEAILKFENTTYDTRRVVKRVSEFLFDIGEVIRLFDKSFADWLVTQTEDSDGLFIQKSRGHQYVANYRFYKENTTLNLRQLSELSMHVLLGGLKEEQLHKLMDINVSQIREPYTGICILHDLAEKRESTAIIRHLIKKFDSVDTLDTLEGLSPMWYAARHGNYDNTKLFLDNGAELDNVHDKWFNPITQIAQKGYTKVAELLIDGGANFDRENRFRETPLMVAAKSGKRDFIELLLREGVKADAITFHRAAANNQLNVVKFLLGEGIRDECLECSPNTTVSSCLMRPDLNLQQFHQCFCETALHAAVFSGHRLIVEEILSRGKSSLECKRRSGKTPLLDAAEKNDTEMATLLLNTGANVDARCEDLISEYEFAISQNYHHPQAYIKDTKVCSWGTQSVHHFARHKAWQTVKEFVNKWHADPFSENALGLTTVAFAIMQDHSEVIRYFNVTYPVKTTTLLKNVTMQRYMALCGSLKTLQLLVHTTNGVCKNLFEDGKTLLHLAVQWSPYPITVAILGKSPSCPQDSFDDVLDVSKYKKRLETVRLLTILEQNMNEKDYYGRTALHYAAAGGFAGAVRHLIRVGSNGGIKDWSKNTPLDLALKESPWYPLHFLSCRKTSDGMFQSCNSTMYDETVRNLIIQRKLLIKKCGKSTRRLLNKVVQKNMPLSLYSALQIVNDSKCIVELFKTHLSISAGPISDRSLEVAEVFKMFRSNLTVGCEIPFTESALHLLAYSGRTNELGNNLKQSIPSQAMAYIYLSTTPVHVFDECRDQEGYLAIHRAVLGGNVDAVDLFLHLGVDVFKTTSSGLNALELSIYYLIPERFSKLTPEEDDLSHLARFLSFHKHHQSLYVHISQQTHPPRYVKATYLVQKLRLQIFEKLLEQSFKSVKVEGSLSFAWCKEEFAALSPLHIAASRGMEMLRYFRKKAPSLPMYCNNKHGIKPLYLAYLYESVESSDNKRKIFLQTPNFPIEGRSVPYPIRNAEYHLIYNNFFQSHCEDLRGEYDFEGVSECHIMKGLLPNRTIMEEKLQRCNNSCKQLIIEVVNSLPFLTPYVGVVDFTNIFEQASMLQYISLKFLFSKIPSNLWRHLLGALSCSRECCCVEIMRKLQKYCTSQPRRNKRVGEFVAKRMGWNDTSIDGDVMYRWPFHFLLSKALKKDKEYEYLKAIGYDIELIV